jgi:hypothetical protein
MLQIALVADEHDGHVGVAILPCLLQPAPEVVEALSAGDVIYKQCPCGDDEVVMER